MTKNLLLEWLLHKHSPTLLNYCSEKFSQNSQQNNFNGAPFNKLVDVSWSFTKENSVTGDFCLELYKMTQNSSSTKHPYTAYTLSLNKKKNNHKFIKTMQVFWGGIVWMKWLDMVKYFNQDLPLRQTIFIAKKKFSCKYTNN